MDEADAERIRRAMVAATPQAPQRHWLNSLVFAGGLAVALALIVGRWPTTPAAPVGPAAPQALETSSGETPQRRQLQFATPGGTRVIWVFDSKFEMR